MPSRALLASWLCAAACLATATLYAQPTAQAAGDAGVRTLQIQSRALRENLVGDPWLRHASVQLPPSYTKAPSRRYPVVYLLHGLGRRRDGHLELVWLFPKVAEQMRRGRLAEMILVAVDGTTAFGGSYYTNSPTIGRFEDYVVDEVVTAVDAAFRTQRERRSRAIAGFSMGGHGAVKLAMRHPDVFALAGSLSGSPLSIRYRKSVYRNALARHRPVSSLPELQERVRFEDNWTLAAVYAKAAAFSPNPGRSGLPLDLPFETTGPEEGDPAWRRWFANDPLTLVASHTRELRELELVYLDHGDEEATLGTEDFVRELVRYDIGFAHYVFDGDHNDRLEERYLRLLRFLGMGWLGSR